MTGAPAIAAGPPRLLVACAAAVLLALGACSSKPGFAMRQRADDAPRVETPGYYDVLERYTDYHSYYDGLDHRFFLAATWQSWAFRQAKAQAVADFLALPEEEARGLLAREREEAGEYVEFFLGLYTAETRWDDLSSPSSIWRLELLLPDGTSVRPVEVERFSRPDANQQALYYYLSPFWTGYRVRFPGRDAAGEPFVAPGIELRLRLSSAVGRATSAWQVERTDLP